MHRCLLVFFAFTFGATQLQAQDRGRLPDGRPYRTTTDGVQMVDYLAELELTIEELQRQLAGLQYDLEQKTIENERLQAGGVGAAGGISERTLVSEKRGENNSFTGPPQRCPVCPQLTCSEPHEIKVPKPALEFDSGRAAAVLSKKLAETQNDLLESENQLVHAREDISRLTLELAQQKTASELQLGQRDVDLKKWTAEVEQLRTENSKLARASAAVTARPPVTEQSAAQGQAVIAAKGALNTELNKLKRLIELRDKRYQEYRQGGHSVSFSPTPTTASSGRNIKVISMRLKQARTMRELALLKRDLSEVQAKMEDDVALLDRMQRVAR